MQSAENQDFEALLLPHLNALFQTALRLTDHRIAAETAVREVYGRALRTSSSHEKLDWRVELFKILMRRLRSRRRDGLFANFAVERDPAAGDLDAPAYSADQMLSALMRIPPAFREVILLVDCQAFSYSGTAEILGLSKEAIADRLVAARRLLRSQFLQSVCATV